MIQTSLARYQGLTLNTPNVCFGSKADARPRPEWVESCRYGCVPRQTNLLSPLRRVPSSRWAKKCASYRPLYPKAPRLRIQLFAAKLLNEHARIKGQLSVSLGVALEFRYPSVRSARSSMAAPDRHGGNEWLVSILG